MDMKKKNYFYRKNEPYLIAEIASAHHGDKRNIYKLVKHAHKSKFDAIKLQIFNTDNFVSKYNSNYKILKKLEFNYIEWKKIINKLTYPGSDKPVGGVGIGLYITMLGIEEDLKIIEIPVTFKRRIGKSKLSGVGTKKTTNIGLRFLWLILTC